MYGNFIYLFTQAETINFSIASGSTKDYQVAKFSQQTAGRDNVSASRPSNLLTTATFLRQLHINLQDALRDEWRNHGSWVP